MCLHPSMHWAGGGVCPGGNCLPSGGGVCSGSCLPGGVCPGGVWLRVCLPRGCLPGGVSALGLSDNPPPGPEAEPRPPPRTKQV